MITVPTAADLLVANDLERGERLARLQAWLRKPDYFAVFGDWRERTDTGNWTFGPTLQHRDSDTITRCNAIEITKALEAIDPDGEDWSIETASHFLVGSMDHLSFRVLGDDGELTEVALEILELWDKMEQYPILNEDALSEMETTEAVQAIIDLNGHEVRAGVPEDWAWQVFDRVAYGSDHGGSDHGSNCDYWPWDAVEKAIDDLGYREVEDDD